MICWIHQPNYLPWIGYFHKIALCDVFVFYDTTQYTKGDYRNRNTIKWANGPIQLTLPVSFSLWQKINEVVFDVRALKKHLQTITQSYTKAPCYPLYKEDLEKIYSYKGNNLSDFCINMTQELCILMGIQTKFITLSQEDFKLTTSSSKALVDICKHVWASTYVVGWDAGYMDSSFFKVNNIKLLSQNFNHPTYTQLWWGFEAYMSIVDLLLNHGKRSKDIIMA